MNTQDKLKHLYWRAGFGLSPDEWKTLKNKSVQSAIDQLFTEAKSNTNIPGEELFNQRQNGKKKLTKEQQKKLRKQNRRFIAKQSSDWFTRMSAPNHSPLLEKMSLFWHGHFACTSKNARPAFKQLMTIRKHALGNFRDFVLAIAKDPSMIRFLNNQQNKKNSPNENFARELMELFTIGRGHYTEQDIKEAARAFTGWSSNFKGEFVFRSRQHDSGEKKFMGQRGTFNGDTIINIILSKKQTAVFIATKIYRYFVNENINSTHVQELADVFYQSDYDIEKMMRTLFESDWFYAPENVGTKIKSPTELVAGMMRQLNIVFKNPNALIFVQKALGQILFKPPNVAGWPGGKTWIDNATLLLRLNLINYLYKASDMSFKVKEEFEAQNRNKAIRKIEATLDEKPLVQLFKNKDNQEIFEGLANYLLQADHKLDSHFLKKFVILNNKEDLVKSLMIRLMSLPEYQLC